MLKAKGTTSVMIDEYADICAQIEELTKRKEEIRAFLSQKKQFQEANKIESQEGNLLTISVRKGSEIPPDIQDVQKVFAEMGKRARHVAETEYAKDVILNKFVEVI